MDVCVANIHKQAMLTPETPTALNANDYSRWKTINLSRKTDLKQCEEMDADNKNRNISPVNIYMYINN